MSIINYNDKIYNFYKYLNSYYTSKYDVESLETLHTCLETNKTSDETKEYYSKIPIFGQTDRNNCFIQDFHTLFDTEYTLLDNYLQFIKENIKPLFNNQQLVIQKTPNIRFHMIGCSNIGYREQDPIDKIGLHCDNELGHPEEEINIVIPITKMYNSNSLYYEKELDIYTNLILNKNDFFIHNLNKIKHYNRINNTAITRVSFDFRIIPLENYKETNNNKFTLGKYYMLI